MATVKSFKDLEIWIRAREIYRRVLHITKTTSLSKDYELKDQMLASSGSIMDNIAEGFARDGKGEFSQFLSIAKASTAELNSQVYRCSDAGHIDEETLSWFLENIESEQNQISKLMIYLNHSTVAGIKFKDRIKPNPKP